jgi:hypothetical protein
VEGEECPRSEEPFVRTRLCCAFLASLVATLVWGRAYAQTVPPSAAPPPPPTAEAAEEARIREYFVPRFPITFSALSVGAGVIGHGLTSDSKGNVTGNGGVFTVAGRVDVEAASPLWVSTEARIWVGAPLEYKLDASVGYELRFYKQWSTGKDGEKLPEAQIARDRWQLRPLVGVSFLSYATSPVVPTTDQAVALRAGLDWTALELGNKPRAWRAHLVALWDVTHNVAGVDGETTWNLPFVPRGIAGMFIGAGGGYLPSSGGMFHIDLGGEWELGH